MQYRGRFGEGTRGRRASSAPLDSDLGRTITTFCSEMTEFAVAEDISVVSAGAYGYVLPVNFADKSGIPHHKGLLFVGQDEEQVIFGLYIRLGDDLEPVPVDEPRDALALVCASVTQALGSAKRGEIPMDMAAAPHWLRIPSSARLARRL